jgi:hypothetical protein
LTVNERVLLRVRKLPSVDVGIVDLLFARFAAVLGRIGPIFQRVRCRS